MICNICKKDLPFDAFLLKSNACFHCVYKNKVMILREEKKKPKTCKICEKEILKDVNKKVRQRSIYCSEKCASNAHKEQVNNFWTNKINCKLEFR